MNGTAVDVAKAIEQLSNSECLDIKELISALCDNVNTQDIYAKIKDTM